MREFKFVGTRSYIVENEGTIVLIIGFCCSHNSTIRFLQCNSTIVKWFVHIVCTRHWYIIFVSELYIFVTHNTIDITCLFFSQSIVVCHTASISDTFQCTHTLIHITMAGRRVVMEITFRKVTRDSVVKNS